MDYNVTSELQRRTAGAESRSASAHRPETISTPLHHYPDEMGQTETSNKHLRLAGNAMDVK